MKKLQPEPELLFKAKAPKKNWEKEYIGKTVLIGKKKIKIRTICGNKFQPNFYEINGTHLIGILRFICQMTGVTEFSEDVFKKFEALEHEVVNLDKSKNPLGLTQ